MPQKTVEQTVEKTVKEELTICSHCSREVDADGGEKELTEEPRLDLCSACIEEITGQRVEEWEEYS